MKKIVIGVLETCSLPELNISDLQIRIDTGAKTSSLHVDDIKRERRGGRLGVSFTLHPDIYDVDVVTNCWAPVSDVRRIKSSNGAIEQRLIIKTTLVMHTVEKEIEITLTNRSDMSYLMLLGREGMGKDFLVDPSQTFLVSEGT
ncbi:MAG: ATP-dependent zinc protease [Oleispira antarctica]|uniref:Retropepsin-like aspartic endopeptidase domain-containing protein n=1 Tax=Oleispira antarctica RB-8 TaxID=698738 RepID=R4YRY3_OLEAN|nr:ATP-dependent zinc protease [Oleispira antarctica]MBQ0791537.1 ATP-dependent zinc protease [Oleispira antarctica]CCK74874.1 conserved hypothetical protein [Oleispira antarctica RB-8]|tara:strand:+ start:1176 stop:1607 length:432 start_codon:yes stop_codon:yes gene_type:complete